MSEKSELLEAAFHQARNLWHLEQSSNVYEALKADQVTRVYKKDPGGVAYLLDPWKRNPFL